jgi:hypothetical protein
MSKASKDEYKKLLRDWKQHLANSKLSPKLQNKRAREFTRKGMNPNES